MPTPPPSPELDACGAVTPAPDPCRTGRLEGCDCSRCRRGVMPVTYPELDRFFYRG